MSIKFYNRLDVGSDNNQITSDSTSTTVSQLYLTNNGTGDASIFIDAGDKYILGSDQSASNFVIASGTALGSNNIMSLDPSGGISFNQYGSGSFSGTIKTNLSVDSNGNVIEGDPAVTGSGIAEYIPKFNSSNSLVNSKAFQSVSSSITTFNIGKSTAPSNFLVYTDQTGALTNYVNKVDFGGNSGMFRVGGFSGQFSGVIEGIKILPSTSHYLTRITPRLEVYPFEDPSTTTDNTYDTNFVGSCFSMGSSNTIGSASSSNLGIFGFNNKIKGDKFVVIGQGNEMDLDANTSSLAVGTTNEVSDGGLINSLLVGQNIDVQKKVTRGIVSGINHGFIQDSSNCLVSGSGNAVYGNNNFIWGANHQGLSGVNNIMQGGFSTQVTNGSGNLYGSVLVGWNNTLSYGSKASLITGRDNEIAKTDHSIVGGFNNDLGQGTTLYENNLVVGKKNQVNADESIVGGDGNTVVGNRQIVSGFNNDATGGNSSILSGSGCESKGNNSITSGENTINRGNNCLVIGSGSQILGGQDNLVIGKVNTLRDGEANQNLISGIKNTINGSAETLNNILVGANHVLGISGNSNTGVKNYALFGSGNRVNSTTSGTEADVQVGMLTGRNNFSRGDVAHITGGNSSIYGDSNTLIGFNNRAGSSTTDRTKNIIIGENIISESSSVTLIGYGMSGVATSVNQFVAVGRHPDTDASGADYSVPSNTTFMVGAATQQNFKRNAIIVTAKSSSSTGDESNVILPGVGKYRNYTSDTDAANNGVPLYGLYRNGNDLKIRIT